MNLSAMFKLGKREDYSKNFKHSELFVIMHSLLYYNSGIFYGILLLTIAVFLICVIWSCAVLSADWLLDGRPTPLVLLYRLESCVDKAITEAEENLTRVKQLSEMCQKFDETYSVTNTTLKFIESRLDGAQHSQIMSEVTPGLEVCQGGFLHVTEFLM